MSEESVQIESSEVTVSQDGQPSERFRALLGYAKTILITLLVALMLKTFVVEAFRIPSSSMEETLQVGDFLLVNKLAYGIRTPRYIPLTNLAIPTYFVPAFNSVERGEVVVFEFPGSFDQSDDSEPVNYIKRCIGLPGDVVQIVDGQVYVNGNPVGLPTYARQSEANGLGYHQRSRMFPWGFGFTEQRYGPLVVPQKGDRIELNEQNLSVWRLLIMREGHSIEFEGNNKILIDGNAVQEYTIEQNYYFVMGDNRDNSLDSRYWGFVPEQNLIGEALVVYWSWDPDVSVSDVWDKLSSIRWSRIGTLIR